jgi:apolipoprotein D and lipocalin family protein
MQVFRVTLLITMILTGVACSTPAPMPVVDSVDLDRFMGDWYVIANIPTFLEKDAYNPMESYQRDTDGTIATTFTFNDGSLDGEQKIYRPRGFVSENSNAIWGMQFIWPIKADYRIVYLDDNYQQTIIGRTSRDYVWIMARTAQISDEDYGALVSQVRSLGYDTALLHKAVHKIVKRPVPLKVTNFEKIEYSAITRGKSELIVVHKGRYSYFLNDKKVLQTLLTKTNFNVLATILAGLDVAAIEDLQAPSKRHQFDGAMVTSLAIKSEGKTHRSATFDDDNPPEELKELVNYLLGMRL